MRLNNPAKLIITIALPQLAGIIGSFFTLSSVNSWYASLEKPPFTPPSWVFGPAWIILYLLIGVAAYLVWSSKKTTPSIKLRAMVVFGLQLLLNASWSVIFFGFQNPFLAFLEITILWFVIIWMIYSFGAISRLASHLLLPYILWVSFALQLNYHIWFLN
ncbi:MAG: TspO/MBR family protein [bacterium]|nr:TspO/MBR family protein [bacterium]